ncbi:uncharacterized protein TNCV_246441 [Trichonephila clavipes]|nr:uncharacterized protein TNCV_246441 [Trichonephila clavipes]
MARRSPFVIHKAIIGIGGEPKSIKKLRSDDLLIETTSALQSVISEPDLLSSSEAEILEGLSDQGVNQPHPSDSKLCPKWKIEKQIQKIKTTKNISYPEARKLIVPQLPQTYAQATKSSTLNNSTQTDENITKINCPPLKLLAPLSSKQRTNIPTAINTSSSAQTQLLPSISSKKSTISNPQPPTPMSKTKGKIKEQPSQLHRPRKDSKTIDLLSIKPTPNLKKNPAKNTTLKTAREQDSPYDSTPVSKRSRRRKTSKTSDAKDTDANPLNSDCVIGLASEEDESLLEADFKKMTDNP